MSFVFRSTRSRQRNLVSTNDVKYLPTEKREAIFDLERRVIDLTAQLVGSVRPDLPKEMHRPLAFILMGILATNSGMSREMFRAAKKGVLPVPMGGRSSMIHVRDLARLLLALREGGEGITHEIFEPDDGHSSGWPHSDLARAIGTAVGKKVRAVPLPGFALQAAAMADERVRGRNARLTKDRASYLAHKDWTVTPDRAVPKDIWQPEILTREGLRDTAKWYREAGML